MRGRQGRELTVMLNGSVEGCLKTVQEAGYDTKVMPHGTPDAVVQRQANKEGRVVVTSDRHWNGDELKRLRKNGAVLIQAKDRSRGGDTMEEKAKLALYALKKVCCARGDVENRIRELKALQIDRTSCHAFAANQLRVLLTTAAAPVRLRIPRAEGDSAMPGTRPASFVIRTAALAGVAAALIAAGALAQERRLRSPPGHSAVQVGGAFDPVQYGYLGGPWIDVYYGRPLKRGRDLFGPPDWAAMLNDGAPVWRAGANRSTRLVTEAPLIIGGARVEPGEYTLFIDLAGDVWTFVVSTWPAQETYDHENRDALFGAFDYTDDRDVLRTPMALETLPASFEQLSWQFLDVTARGGRLALLWDDRMASVRFTVAE